MEGARGKGFPPQGSPPPPPRDGSARPLPSLSSHLTLLRSSLTDLEKGIQGLIVMSTSLEEIFNCIFDAHVPPLWGKARLHHSQTSVPSIPWFWEAYGNMRCTWVSEPERFKVEIRLR